MTQKQNTLPEVEFLKALETLETLAKGAVPNGEGESLEKSVEGQAEGATASEPVAEPAAEAGTPEGEVIEKGGDDGDGEAGDDENKDGDDMEKSVTAEPAEGADPAGANDERTTFDEVVEGSESISKAIEVSDFLAELVTKVCGAVDSIRKSVDDRMAAMEKSLTDSIARGAQIEMAVVDALKKSFQAVSIKTDEQAEELRKSIAGMSAELGKQPARTAPKSKTTVLEKSFEVGGDAEPKAVTKDSILKSLTSMVEAGDSGVAPIDVIRFESGGQLPPAVRKKLGLE